MPKTDRISLSEHGLAKFLSGIELRVMEYMWSRTGPSTSSEIAAAIGGVKLTTIAPILDRLTEAGLVCRKLDESGDRLRYLYSTCCGREDAQRALVDRVAKAMVDSFGHIAVAAFSEYVPPREQRGSASGPGGSCSTACTLFLGEPEPKPAGSLAGRRERDRRRGGAG